ncbi:hypothetical protein IAT38_001268 [Cryptococcus sp. DSM 104549]
MAAPYSCRCCPASSSPPHANPFEINDLSSLPHDIQTLIFEFVKHTTCRTHLVSVILTCKKVFDERIRALYHAVDLHAGNTWAFYAGLEDLYSVNSAEKAMGLK